MHKHTKKETLNHYYSLSYALFLLWFLSCMKRPYLFSYLLKKTLIKLMLYYYLCLLVL